jgi:hypothetical protein
MSSAVFAFISKKIVELLFPLGASLLLGCEILFPDKKNPEALAPKNQFVPVFSRLLRVIHSSIVVVQYMMFDNSPVLFCPVIVF